MFGNINLCLFTSWTSARFKIKIFFFPNSVLCFLLKKLPKKNSTIKLESSTFHVRPNWSFYFRSAPTSSTATVNYKWPPSPILPPVRSRIAHLTPSTLMSETASATDEHHHTNTSHYENSNDPQQHNSSSGRDTSAMQYANHTTGSWITNSMTMMN